MSGADYLVLITGIVILYGLAEILKEREERRVNEKCEHYRKLYESGEIYKDIDALWRCLVWLAQHDKEELHAEIWRHASLFQQVLITHRVMKERARSDSRDSSEPWQTSAYPSDGGDGGE